MFLSFDNLLTVDIVKESARKSVLYFHQGRIVPCPNRGPVSLVCPPVVQLKRIVVNLVGIHSYCTAGHSEASSHEIRSMGCSIAGCGIEKSKPVFQVCGLKLTFEGAAGY